MLIRKRMTEAARSQRVERDVFMSDLQGWQMELNDHAARKGGQHLSGGAWSFSLSISPSNEYSGLISFWMDWLDLLAVQETLKSLLQYHSSKASILQCSAFFIVQ